MMTMTTMTKTTDEVLSKLDLSMLKLSTAAADVPADLRDRFNEMCKWHRQALNDIAVKVAGYVPVDEGKVIYRFAPQCSGSANVADYEAKGPARVIILWGEQSLRGEPVEFRRHIAAHEALHLIRPYVDMGVKPEMEMAFAMAGLTDSPLGHDTTFLKLETLYNRDILGLDVHYGFMLPRETVRSLGLLPYYAARLIDWHSGEVKWRAEDFLAQLYLVDVTAVIEELRIEMDRQAPVMGNARVVPTVAAVPTVPLVAPMTTTTPPPATAPAAIPA